MDFAKKIQGIPDNSRRTILGGFRLVRDSEESNDRTD
jgi:hypothetical protein